jgi:ATP-dependent DNA helicase DinG
LSVRPRAPRKADPGSVALSPSAAGELRLVPRAAAAVRAAIQLAGGREVCFVGVVDAQGRVQSVRPVARGDASSVLALPGFAQRGEMLIHNHPSGELEPSDADLMVAARLHDDGIGFGICSNDAGALYVVVEVPRTREQQHIDLEILDWTLGPDGPLAAALDLYEDRDSQRGFARAIAGLYNGGGIGLFEAGTGVGKSLGYLLPALQWAAANGERTIISTNTINLQEQLVGKDLPLLARAFGEKKIRFALLKGWRNYLCLARLEQALESAPALVEDDAARELAGLRDWAERTGDGSLSDLPVQPHPDTWDEVSAEADLCTRLKCAHFERCFLFSARRQAAQADVIVVNHHLLLSDLAVRRAQQNWTEAAVLPGYTRLVVDEGHHLEDAAAVHLGVSVTRRALFRALGRLERRGGKGLLAALLHRLSAQDDLLSVASLDLVRSLLTPSVHAAREKGSLLFDMLAAVLASSGEQVLRLTDDFAHHPVWAQGLEAGLSDLLAELRVLEDGLRLVRERLETDSARAEALAPLVNEIRSVARRLVGLGDGLEQALRPSKGVELVRWMEMRGRDGNIGVTAVPLDIAPILREDLWQRVDTAIVTSATLATGTRFDFLRQRLGLDTAELEPATGLFPSPFDYERQALLAVPSDLPAPNADPQAHLRGVIDIVADLVEAADGGVFALFTSHRDVRAAALVLRDRFGGRWPLLVHGEESRDVLLRRFRNAGSAVLLGTTSFWEGVDVAGRALRGLVLARIPFKVPTEPLTAARCEAIEREGGDAFGTFMVPHATLRLKQGFGRLIRSNSDRGVVVLCDPRVFTKGYGRRLLEALPPARRLRAPWAALRSRIEEFYLEEPERT